MGDAPLPSVPEDPVGSEESIPRGANPPATREKVRGLGEGGGRQQRGEGGGAMGVAVDDGDDAGEVGGGGGG